MTDRSRQHNQAAQVKVLLDQETAQLDPAITDQLRKSRQAAVATMAPPGTRWYGLSAAQRWPGYATALVLLLALSLWFGTRPTTSGPKTEELELLANQGSLEMYHDLDFYAWLARADETR